MEIFTYLQLMLKWVVWVIPNLDLCLGGLSIAALGMNSATVEDKVTYTAIAIVCTAIRVVRIIRKKRYS